MELNQSNTINPAEIDEYGKKKEGNMQRVNQENLKRKIENDTLSSMYVQK